MNYLRLTSSLCYGKRLIALGNLLRSSHLVGVTLSVTSVGISLFELTFLALFQSLSPGDTLTNRNVIKRFELWISMPSHIFLFTAKMLWSFTPREWITFHEGVVVHHEAPCLLEYLNFITQVSKNFVFFNLKGRKKPIVMLLLKKRFFLNGRVENVDNTC